MVWPYKKLGDLADVSSGGTPRKGVAEFWEGKIAWYSSGELNSHHTIEPKQYITSAGLDGSNAKLFPAGSLLIGMYDTAALKMSILDREATFNQAIAGVKPNDELDLSFVLYAIEQIKPELLKQRRGVRQKNLNQGMIKGIMIPDLPIFEQKRIVAILDQAFADIEQARTKTEQNLKNAHELFESYLQQVFSQRCEGWKVSKLKEITFKIGSGATPRGGREAYKEEGISLIRSMNVHDRYFKRKDLAFIDDQQAAKLSNVVVENNDVLLNITGASVARCCLAPEELLPARVNQHVSIIRVDKKVINPAFLNFILTSKYYKDQLLGIGEAGSTRQAITKTQIEEFIVAYPESLGEQEKLLHSLYSLQEQTNDMKRIYNEKLIALDELKKSILQKAFSGELSKDKEGAAA